MSIHEQPHDHLPSVSTHKYRPSTISVKCILLHAGYLLLLSGTLDCRKTEAGLDWIDLLKSSNALSRRIRTRWRHSVCARQCADEAVTRYRGKKSRAMPVHVTCGTCRRYCMSSEVWPRKLKELERTDIKPEAACNSCADTKTIQSKV